MSARQSSVHPDRRGLALAPCSAWYATLLLPLAVLASGARAQGTALITDSAGVRIITSRAPVWRAGQGWRIAATPTLTIGEDPKSPAEEFTTIRRLYTLGDGRIVVVNANRPAEIRVFDKSGAFQHSIGHSGAGPGEYRAIWDVWLAPPDSLIVFDPSNSRITTFDADGKPLNMVTFEQKGSRGVAWIAWARFADGTFYMRRNQFIENAQGEGRSLTLALRGQADGTVLDTLGHFPESDFVTLANGAIGAPRFAKLAVIMAHGLAFLRGMGDSYAVDEYDVHGRELRSMRRRFEPRPVTDALVNRLQEAELAAATTPERKAAIQKDYTERPRLKTLPAFGNAWIIDSDNDLGAQDYRTAVDTTNTWTVFDAGGQWLGVVSFPATFQPHEIGADYVLGVFRNALDVETVRRYALQKH